MPLMVNTFSLFAGMHGQFAQVSRQVPAEMSNIAGRYWNVSVSPNVGTEPPSFMSYSATSMGAGAAYGLEGYVHSILVGLTDVGVLVTLKLGDVDSKLH